ncbi:DUF3396 domain-containing protein [Corallococcus sp. AB049A]|uniref:DUF3396 domain-containing protein n=1 Tax=Corallococcus sp. AB049A TaxID=2316721 RepID=UPI000EC0FA42|nr:DUF3396 domain-containing protein [Corallococcus sp. AB049A]RKI58306.1 DUF3396 domain-containing protein [Corallococcus sp. AB049A]
MKSIIPTVRLRLADDHLVVRDGLQICLYMPYPHEHLKAGIQRALDVYLGAVGREALGFYVDLDGQWQSLDTQGWEFIQQDLQGESGARVHMVDAAGPDASDTLHQYEFEYIGKALGHPDAYFGPNAVSALRIGLPTEYMEEQGPSRVRELALELAGLVPFSSGHGGLSFNGIPQASTVRDQVKTLSHRYPALDVLDLDDVARELGTRVRAPAWMNFLGAPVLSELGGIEALRSRLHSPETTVQVLGQDRAVVTLGPYPEAGDTEQGQLLPAYRELARVLEPLLYQTSDPADSDFFYSTRRWQRRFLD